MADLRDAGRAAFEQHRWDEAFQLLTDAAGAGPVEPTDLEFLAEAARWSRRFEAMLEAFERAQVAYTDAGDRRGAARCALRLVIEHYFRAEDALALARIEQAARLLEGDEECSEYGLLLWLMARGCFDRGDLAGAAELSSQVVALGHRLGDRNLEAIGLLDRGHGLVIAGDVDEGSRLIDAAAAMALGGELDLWTTGEVYCSTIVGCRNRGDWRRASEWTDASIRWCQRASVSGFPGLCRLHRAEVLRLRGDLERAERDASEAANELLGAAPRFAAWAYHELGDIRRRRGDGVGAREAFRRSSELGFDPQPGWALLHHDEGRIDAAHRSITATLEDESGNTQYSHGSLLPAAVRIGLAAGDEELVRHACQRLEALATQHGTTATAASAAVAAGEVALADARHEDAIRLLRKGCQAWSEVDAPFEVADARTLLAAAYAGLGDRDDATLQLETAHAIFEKIGAVASAARVADLISGSQTSSEQPERTTRTFLFSDIVGSTALVDVLGDEAWEHMLGWHDRTLREQFAKSGGEEVKHEGDGFFVAFECVDDALACACAVQRVLADHRRDHGFAPSVRIGLHTAEASKGDGDYRGRGVHATARIAAAAAPGQILASVDTLDAAARPVDASDPFTLELKGLSDPVAVTDVSWS